MKRIVKNLSAQLLIMLFLVLTTSGCFPLLMGAGYYGSSLITAGAFTGIGAGLTTSNPFDDIKSEREIINISEKRIFIDKRIYLEVYSSIKAFKIDLKNELEEKLLRQGYSLVEKNQSNIEIIIRVEPPPKSLANWMPGNYRKIGKSTLKIVGDGKTLSMSTRGYGNPGKDYRSVASDLMLSLLEKIG